MIGDSVSIRDLAVSVGSLTVGLHLMYIRLRDVTGKWSTLEPQPIRITATIGATAAALNFDGSNDYITLPNDLSTAATTGDAITIEYWFKGSSLESAVRMQYSNNTGWHYIVAGYSNQHFMSTDGTLIMNNASVNVTDGNWHHIAMTWQRNTTNGYRSYVDGNLIAQKNASDVALPNIQSGIWIGSFNGNTEITKGSFDEVRIWNRALPQSEIQSTMNCELGCARNGLLAYYKFNQGVSFGNNSGVNTLLDDSGNGYNGTLNNFALTGRVSNWSYLGGVTTGASCTAAATPSVSITTSATTICTGTSVTFTATALNVGDGTVTYHFKIGSTSVQNTTSNTFTSNTLANGNALTCTITITGGTACLTATTATSNTINMSVNSTAATPSVNIAASPSSTVNVGTTVTFTATPANAGTTPSYQWKKNNSVVGTNSPTYSDATLLNGDVITCLFTSTVCSSTQTVTSNSITMTVIPDVTTLAIGIAIYPDPTNRAQLLVKVKPNLTVPNYLYSAGIFTVKFPTLYNTSLSVGSSTYGFTVGQIDATGSNTYFSFNIVRVKNGKNSWQKKVNKQ